jgi:tripartite-type tricarboxylate transporter receptor subunit TctC
MATASPLSYVPSVKRNPPYDPLLDFTPISYFATFTFFMMVHPSVPVTNMTELINYARTNPGKLSYATGNTTSILAMAQFNAANKLSMVHVPYKGEAQAVADLVPGRVQLMWATPAVLPQLTKAGMKPLAVLLSSRSALMPDVPTMAETGQNLVSITPWGGFVGPAKMSKDITERLSREFAVVLRKPDVKDQLDKLGLPGRPSSPEEFAGFIREQLQVWDRALRDAGIGKE